MILLGQVLITDPSEQGAGGYSLIGASTLIEANDIDYLERRPPISDELHRAEDPLPQLSFHPLPSGAWAFSRRFINGRRRGAFNRIVVHTLVLDARALDAIIHDPWLLLPEGMLFLDGRPCTLHALGEAALAARSSTLLPVQLVPSPAPSEDRIREILARRDALAAQLGANDLAATLGTVFGAVHWRERVLLPAGTEGQRLLALAWSALPLSDRRQVSWSTHLAPTEQDVVQMAAAADDQQETTVPRGWHSARDTSPAQAHGAGALAALVGHRSAQVSEALHGLDTFAFGLIDRVDAVGRWTYYLTSRERATESTSSLEDFLDWAKTVMPGPGATQLDPWVRPGAVLAEAIRFVLQAPTGSHGSLADTLADELARLCSPDLVFGVSAIEALLARSSGDAPGTIIAFTMATRTLDLMQLPTQARAQLFELAHWHQLPGAILAGVLAGQLVARDASLSGQIRKLAFVNGGLDHLIAGLPDNILPDNAVLVAECAAEVGRPDAGAAILRKAWIPRWKPPAPAFNSGELRKVLRLTRPAPAPLADALRSWRESAWNEAAWELQDLLASDSDAALAVLRAYAPRPDEVPLETNIIVPLAVALARARLPPADWLAFAFAAALCLDKLQSESALMWASALQLELRYLDVRAPDAGPVCCAIFAHLAARQTPNWHLFRSSEPENDNDTSLRELASATVRGVWSCPDLVIEAVDKRLGNDQSASRWAAAWAPVICKIAVELEKQVGKAAAMELRRRWWTQISLDALTMTSPCTVDMLRSLPQKEAQLAIRRFSSQISERSIPIQPEIRTAIKNLIEQDPETAVLGRALRLRYEVERGGWSYPEAVAELAGYASKAGCTKQQLVRAMREFWPMHGNHTRKVIENILSPRVLPATKNLIQEQFLAESLDRSGKRVFDDLPGIAAFERRATALMAIAKHAARFALSQSDKVVALLDSARAHQRRDFLEAFCHTLSEDGHSDKWTRKMNKLGRSDLICPIAQQSGPRKSNRKRTESRGKGHR